MILTLASAPLWLGPLLPAAPVEGAESVPLTYKGYRTWDIELPAEQFAPLSGGFPIGGVEGAFRVELDGTDLAVDTDGDAVCDLVLDALPDAYGVRRARVTLEGPAADGGTVHYVARLMEAGQGWHFAASGALVGEVAGTQVRLIDQNNNGRYDDFGTDAMIVGRGSIATFLSRAVLVGDAVYSIELTADGSSLSWAPFQGELGELDLSSGFETRAKLLSVVLKSSGGDYSFDLARARGPVKLPAADYRIATGKLGLGQATVRIEAGRMQTLAVGPTAPQKLEWGGPVKAEFRYARQGGQLVIDPANVRYFGAAGEAYGDWFPKGKSPEFTVKEIEAGTEVAKALFPGSC